MDDVRDWPDTMEGKEFVERARVTEVFSAYVTAKGKQALRLRADSESDTPRSVASSTELTIEAQAFIKIHRSPPPVLSERDCQWPRVKNLETRVRESCPRDWRIRSKCPRPHPAQHQEEREVPGQEG